MADEISTKLSKIKGVDVAPRDTVVALKTTDKSAADIGRQLGVRYLLEGSVRKAGNQVRINVQLIDSGFQTWADDLTVDLQKCLFSSGTSRAENRRGSQSPSQPSRTGSG